MDSSMTRSDAGLLHRQVSRIAKYRADVLAYLGRRVDGAIARCEYEAGLASPGLATSSQAFAQLTSAPNKPTPEQWRRAHRTPLALSRPAITGNGPIAGAVRGPPKQIITDKLGSYGAARRKVMPDFEHRQHKGLNNRAEIPTLPSGNNE